MPEMTDKQITAALNRLERILASGATLTEVQARYYAALMMEERKRDQAKRPAAYARGSK